MRRLTTLAALAAGVLLVVAAPAAARPDTVAAAPVNIQLLTVSDWHGQLTPVNGVGGAAVLSSYFQADRAANPNTLTFMAGDSFGATPPISSFFDDEPAVRAMNLMGISADTFGNHNFDGGIAHLQSLIDLAEFPFLSANLKNVEDNLTGVDKMTIFNVGGIKVAVIGITNEEAPTLVTPGSFGTIQVTNGVTAANKTATAARKAGAKVVVVLTHKGIRGFDGGGNAFGELIDFANGVNRSLVDVIVGDHTDFQFSGVVNGILAVENLSKGATYAKIQLTVDPATGLKSRSASFAVPLASAVTPDPVIQAMIDDLNAQLSPILGTVIGNSTVEVLRSDSCGRADGRLCESKVGNVVTDALRQTYGTDFAITNSGGLRAALTCPAAGSAGFCPSAITPPPFPITRGSVLGVLPFGNEVATTTVSGAELKTFLENGVSAMPGANGRFAQVSGLCFTYEITTSPGSRVTSIVGQAADGSCTGAAISPSATYSLAINDFMAAGGDGYPNVAFKTTSRNLMDADVADYIAANSPISPSIQGRISCTDANGTATTPNCPVVTSP
jgi:2',3'-cyclic-nucleotide 2'-phosphodiesterase (5'-nucleotidase family)